MRGRTPDRGGYSLVEMLLVCALVGVAMAVAVPNLRSYRESQRVASVSQQVAAACRAAQSRARSRNQSVVIQVNVDANSYTIVDDVNGNGQADGGEPARVHPLPSGLTLQATTLPNDRLVFDTRGRALSGGNIVVNGGEGVEPRRVRISSGTGHVKVQGGSGS